MAPRCSPQTLTPLLHSGVYVVSGSPQILQSVCGPGELGESLEKHTAGRLLNLKGEDIESEEERIVQAQWIYRK